MADKPDDLVIRILREIQGTLSEHSEEFRRLNALFARPTTVMPGLEPGIQGPHARRPWPWIAGSSPAMTGVHETPES